MNKMNYKILGSSLMLLGTCTGAGMLGLPLVGAQYNFATNLFFLVSSWLIMTIGAFALLEVNLWMPSGSNLFTMTKNTLGRYGNIFALVIYLLLLYSLVSLYISNSRDLLQGYLQNSDIHLSHTSSTILAFSILMSIEIFGIRIIDLANRWLMFIKLAVLLIIVTLMLSQLQMQNVSTGEYSYFSAASFMSMITAFGFAIILPSLRDYLEDNHKSLIISMVIGCLIPLILYTVWVLAVHGMLPKTGSNGLINIAKDANLSTRLISAVSAASGYTSLKSLSGTFITICTITSFLGVGLCLVDFIKDMINNLYTSETKNSLLRSIVIYSIAFAPPLIAVLIHPGLFLAALAYAGRLVLIFLVILPLLMVYSGRYCLNYVGRKFIPGGKLLIMALLIINILILALSFITHS